MGNGFRENSIDNIDMKKYHQNYERIFGDKKEIIPKKVYLVCKGCGATQEKTGELAWNACSCDESYLGN